MSGRSDTANAPLLVPIAGECDGLTAQLPTFDSFYDDTHGYALTQRVRQAYQLLVT